MNRFQELMEQAGTIAVSGHMRPDGDCIGSNMALYSYIRSAYPEKKVCVYLEEIPHAFDYLKKEEAYAGSDEEYDLFVSLDCGDLERLGEASSVFKRARITVNMDHHISNTMFAMENIVDPKASSTCEVLFNQLDEEKIDFSAAVALYTGIIHDTGVFKHSCTSRRTMEVAGKLMEKGIPFGKIIDESFYLKSYTQLQILGRCLLESIRIMDGICIFSVVSREMMHFYEAVPSDLDGVIDQLRATEHVEVAILLVEKASGQYKVSMRSNGAVNVNRICQFFGGGGHILAAGCTLDGSFHDVVNNLTKHIEAQLKESYGRNHKRI